MAEVGRIKVVPHSLIRLADGSLGYITHRIDRPKNFISCLRLTTC